jgi:D-inositol-3-phosphate glycosyltransferase
VISFVWEPGLPLPAGTGGSENYTIGHVRELNRRGIAARVVTIGLGDRDGREQFTGIPFHSVGAAHDISGLDDTVVFVTQFPVVATKRPSYQILHVPPPLRDPERDRVRIQTRDRALIATSRFAATLWSEFLDVDVATIEVVYPFAEPCFARQARPVRDPAVVRVLYAGRLTPEKGIYTLLAMLHSDLLPPDQDVKFTVTRAGDDKPQGQVIGRMLDVHPRVSLVPSRKSPGGMAALMGEHDIVVMPSNSQYWHETFGIVSIEAQHAGCRVVASDDGGLPETDCGAVTLVAPDNAEALARGLLVAMAQGTVSPGARLAASVRFTVEDSVSALLAVFARPRTSTPADVLKQLEELVALPSPDTLPTRQVPPATVTA